ncbi:hypothetical protein N798_09820 [Knoellia flava TL1]|uniref:DUF559 domain-containing protein n=2 Tax=Knoellia flava TaxID=913969 RepID=A0A8H9FX45_9MICO|nr:DUF559 domain-containing protein [Knoellia flava]KGN30943.1 hypothetical protein N798_09820 [Knoellia flava TL1]GGB84252.1 hypothetical protein GCM10011314_24880 [Knoellia flava]
MPDFDPRRPFRTDWAVTAGMTRRELAGPAYRQLFRGIHIDASVPDTLVVRARAALLRAPEHALLSHDTAAQLWVPSWPSSSDVHLSFSRSVKTIGEGIRTHRFRYRMERWQRHGMPTTGPAMTFIHLAVRMDLIELVSFGDRLVARGAVSTLDLVAAAEAWQGHGRRAAISAAGLVRERSESVPETHSRLLVVLAGLPEPVCNHPFLVDGVERFRLDLAWVGVKVALEYDGRWHDDPEQREKDEKRRAEMRAAGWIIIVIRARDLYDEPDEVVDQVTAALRSRGCDVQPDRRYRRWFQPRGRVA